MTNAIPVIPRYSKRHDEILLFLPADPVGASSWMSCYARIGQHGDACREYYLSTTPRIPPHKQQELKALLREYENLGPDKTPLRILQRDTAALRAARFKR